jgi:hypothetical protein
MRNYLRRGLSPVRDSGLSRAQIALAVPAGSRRPRSQRGFLRVAEAEPDLDDVRADFRGHLVEWARIHARYADWGDMTTRPTRKRACEQGGFGVTTYKRCRQWWSERGYVGLVEPGSTPEFQPAVLRSTGKGNIAQVYVLAVPSAREKRWQRLVRKAREITRPPSGISQMRDAPSSRAREQGGDAPDLSVLRAGPWKNLSDKALATCARPYLAAGYSVADLAFARDHRFGGEQWRLSLRTVRRPAGLLRWRWRHWLGGDGRPLPSRSQQLEASAPPLPAGWQHLRPLPPRERQIASAVKRSWGLSSRTDDLAAADAAAWAARIRAGFTGKARWVQDQLDLGLGET